jgi:hypothetical protein
MSRGRSGIRHRDWRAALAYTLIGARTLSCRCRASGSAIVRRMACGVENTSPNGTGVTPLLIEQRVDVSGACGSARGRTRNGEHAAVACPSSIRIRCVDAHDEHHRRHKWAFGKCSPDALDRPQHAPHSGRESCTVETKIFRASCQRKNRGMQGVRSHDKALPERTLRNAYRFAEISERPRRGISDFHSDHLADLYDARRLLRGAEFPDPVHHVGRVHGPVEVLNAPHVHVAIESA